MEEVEGDWGQISGRQQLLTPPPSRCAVGWMLSPELASALTATALGATLRRKHYLKSHFVNMKLRLWWSAQRHLLSTAHRAEIRKESQLKNKTSVNLTSHWGEKTLTKTSVENE